MAAVFAPGSARKLAALFYDFAASAAAFYLALNFSFGRGVALVQLPGIHVSTNYTLIFALIASVFVLRFGLHRTIWRYTSLLDFVAILRVATLTVLVFLPIAFLTVRANLLPRSTPAIAWFLMVAFVGAPRLFCRVWADSRTPAPMLVGGRKASTTAIPILIAGDIRRIEPFIRELGRRKDAPYYAAGILTDDRAEHARVMYGVPVLGARHDITNALAYLQQRNIRPQRLVLADDRADEIAVSSYLDCATRNGLTLGRLPRLTDITSNPDSNLGTVQPVAIADLLGRPQAVLDRDAMRAMIDNRRVLVTGAGGSIGSELIRQIAQLGPKKLILLDNTEFNLYSIEKELSERHPDIERQEALCDIRDRAGINRWFIQERPDVVFHAAALKHVPLVEAHPIEGIRTNILGTQNVADACVQFGVANMVLISTDKAVNPHNLMGASKRCAEAYCQAMDAQDGAPKFTIVRFGNVLGSAGSVIPLFQRQLERGGPLTVTHPEISRYFMTIPEAVSLVLQAAASSAGNSDARGVVHVLDMGKPIKIADLARQMIRLSGKRPDIDVKIEFIGLRAGEKLHEELIHKEEHLEKSAANGVMVISPRTMPLPILRNWMGEMTRAADGHDHTRVFRLLKMVVPEFARNIPEEAMMPPAAGE